MIVSGETDWVLVEKMMLRSEVLRPCGIPCPVSWARSYPGGRDPYVHLDVLHFAKGLKVARELQSAVLGSFEKIYLGPSGSPYWRGAAVKAMLSARQKDITNGINMYVSVTDVQNWGKANLKFVQSANSIMEQAREITTERAVQTIGADIIETLIDTLDIRLCAHVQKRPLQGEFKSLLEIAGQFFDLRTACQHARVKFTDEPPKEWILPTAAAATVANTRVSKVTELCKGKLTASQVAVHFKTQKVEAGKKVTEISSRRVLVVEEINDTSVVLVEEGRKRKERFAVADFLSQFDVPTYKKPEDS